MSFLVFWFWLDSQHICSCLPWLVSDFRHSFKSFLTGSSFLFAAPFPMSLTAISANLRSVVHDAISMASLRAVLASPWHKGPLRCALSHGNNSAYQIVLPYSIMDRTSVTYNFNSFLLPTPDIPLTSLIMVRAFVALASMLAILLLKSIMFIQSYT